MNDALSARRTRIQRHRRKAPRCGHRVRDDSDMTWTAPLVTRVEAPHVDAERAMLDGWLDYQRQTLLFKCQGLTADQLKLAAAPPSTLTLLGLVRHMSEVERGWFRRSVGGQEVSLIYCSDEYEDGDFDNVADADAEAEFAVYEAELAEARAAAAGRGLDETFHSRRRNELSVRWVYLHMIEEYARHNGHADILRERIDGVTGA
jgi:hypothetical protein